MGSIYGYEVESELPLRRLRAAPGARGRLRVERGPEGLLDQPGELTAWLEWPGNEDRFALARGNGALLAWWSESGTTFEIDPTEGRIRVDAPRFDPLSEHKLATTVIPLLLAERGDLALHGSVVAADGRGVLFCGPSGRGKSTLALLASRLGHPVLSEDGAVIEARVGTVWPGPRGVFIEDQLTIAATAGARAAANGSPVTIPRRRDLQFLAPELEATDPAPVGAICQLAGRRPKLSVKRLSPAEAVPALVPNLLHGGGPDSLRPAVALLARILERVPVYRVSMPDRMSRATTATESLLNQVASWPTGPGRSADLRSSATL